MFFRKFIDRRSKWKEVELEKIFQDRLSISYLFFNFSRISLAYDLSETNNKVTDLKLVEEVGYNGTLYSGYLDGYRKGSVMADPKEEK